MCTTHTRGSPFSSDRLPSRRNTASNRSVPDTAHVPLVECARAIEVEVDVVHAPELRNGALQIT